ncbi:unnamed protein product [Brachionus calyciflorus]|uniref:Uncharacterized protein n=1 Tax=Brachionus calyciflorus TaxID=104777 RepID=A0A814I7V3_9BILA|nr:unnamed protein product [Brachionus calyciflorus]
MFKELVLILFQACASIFAIALTTIVVKVTVNLFNVQNGYGSHNKPDSVSSLKSPVASNVKLTQETPERVRRDHLESFTVKPDLTRAWYDSDQIGINRAYRRNDDVIANSSKGSPQIQSEKQQTVPLPVLNKNKLNSWSKNPTNQFSSTWCADDATREMKTPVNPFKACEMVVKNKSDYDRSVRNQDFTAVTPVSGNIMYCERFVTGLNEPSVFWRFDAAKTQTCAEAYDLVDQSYARLEILKRNKPTVEQRSVVDQTEFRTEQSFIPKRPAEYQTNNKPTVEIKRFCHICNKSGHVIARMNQMKNMTLNNQSNAELSVSNRVINRVMFDESKT